MSKESEKVYIMAREQFTDLHSKLSTMDFVEAGHLPVGISFSDKSKSEEGKGEKYTIDDSVGYTVDKEGNKTPAVVRKRAQASDIITSCGKMFFLEGKKDVKHLYDAFNKVSPYHFNTESPVYIKELITRHIDSGWLCYWEKIKVSAKEYRLMLTAVKPTEEDWLSSTEVGLDVIESIAEGMWENLCTPKKIYTHAMNVCSMYKK